MPTKDNKSFCQFTGKMQKQNKMPASFSRAVDFRKKIYPSIHFPKYLYPNSSPNSNIATIAILELVE